MVDPAAPAASFETPDAGLAADDDDVGDGPRTLSWGDPAEADGLAIANIDSSVIPIKSTTTGARH
ncbi:MAG: hypothetical protein KC420_06225 [Myxococcales bacterium]|nr:hypothetical protein [Myxococcales bacterium]MCB9566618.1 hypothetical protein [Myxococcales bacterium]MCB9704350.1 hypothetical protein [Myxococcales bacterium]